MENLKIKVNDESESKEAQELFFELGCYWAGEKNKDNVIKVTDGRYIFSRRGEMTYCDSSEVELNGVGFNLKEITMQELRDMVVFKRNDPDDANFENKVTGIRYFVSSAGDIYFWCGDWQKCHASFRIEQLNPIKEEVVKEYLFKYNDQYALVELSKEDVESNPEQYIEIPEWANYAYNNDIGVCFFKNAIGYNHPLLIWQRESLNDKIASAEVARQQSKNIDATLAERQSQYGSFEDVAFVTENIMATLAKVRSNGLLDLPHTHRMALYMIASKMARIVNGDFNHLDSWHDIGGYSKLIEDLITVDQ